MDARTAEFLEHVQSGGLVETRDWMPDEYRARLTKFVEMHANSELMGVLPERDWILRAPTLQRKLALTAKIQDEVGHAQLLYRVVEDLGKPRDACLDDLIAGRSKFHNVFHYPTRTWGDVGVIAWLVDAAAIISQKALLKCSYAPYGRIMRKICWEESFHWRIKSQANEDARQQFLEGYVPQVWELGLTLPDAKLRRRDDGVWEYTEPDWEELRQVVTGHGPKTAERLELRRFTREETAWVRQSVLAEPRAA